MRPFQILIVVSCGHSPPSHLRSFKHEQADYIKSYITDLDTNREERIAHLRENEATRKANAKTQERDKSRKNNVSWFDLCGAIEGTLGFTLAHC